MPYHLPICKKQVVENILQVDRMMADDTKINGKGGVIVVTLMIEAKFSLPFDKLKK